MENLSPGYLDEQVSYDHLKERTEYWDFVNWIATPTPLREPKTQRELGVKIGITEVTLSRWKLTPEYGSDVMLRVRYKMRDDTANVWAALRNKIFEKGDAAEVKLFLEWAHDWMSGIKVKHSGEIEISADEKEIEEIAKRVAEELKKEYDKPKPN